MNLDQAYYGRSNGLRKKYPFDQHNEEHKAIEEATFLFRQALYNYADNLFKNSPKLLLQLSPKRISDKGGGLSLLNSETPPSITNAKNVILRFLIKRADILVDQKEKDNLKLLVDYVNNFQIEKELV